MAEPSLDVFVNCPFDQGYQPDQLGASNTGKSELSTGYRVVRISKGRFEPGRYAEVERLIGESAEPLIPALTQL